MSERLKKVQPLSKKDNNVGDNNAPMAWDRNITEKEDIFCIDWRVVTGSSDNIGARAKIDTLFFGKNVETLQKSWRRIVR